MQLKNDMLHLYHPVWNIPLILALSLPTSSSASPDPTECPTGSKVTRRLPPEYQFHAVAGKYYRLHSRDADYVEAQSTCNEEGATLVQPKTAEQLQALRGLAGKRQPKYRVTHPLDSYILLTLIWKLPLLIGCNWPKQAKVNPLTDFNRMQAYEGWVTLSKRFSQR